MTHPVPSPVDRKRYGALADDIVLLRSDGKIVAPYKGGFRVDSSPEIFTAEAIVRKAAELRARRTKSSPSRSENSSASGRAGTTSEGDTGGSPATPYTAGPEQGAAGSSRPPDDAPHADRQRPPAMPAPAVGERGTATSLQNPQTAIARVPAGDEPANAGGGHDAGLNPAPEEARTAPPASATSERAQCLCGRFKGHGGRCWAQRGMSGPTVSRRPAAMVTCGGCGGPRSVSARGDLYRKCVLEKFKKSATGRGRLASLEAEVAALKARQAEFEAKVRAAFGDVVAHLELEEGR